VRPARVLRRSDGYLGRGASIFARPWRGKYVSRRGGIRVAHDHNRAHIGHLLASLRGSVNGCARLSVGWLTYARREIKVWPQASVKSPREGELMRTRRPSAGCRTPSRPASLPSRRLFRSAPRLQVSDSDSRRNHAERWPPSRAAGRQPSRMPGRLPMSVASQFPSDFLQRLRTGKEHGNTPDRPKRPPPHGAAPPPSQAHGRASSSTRCCRFHAGSARPAA